MKDKTDNKVHDDFSLENIKSRVRAKVETNRALFTLTGSTITSTKPIDMNSQNISGLAAPKQNSDAVSLDYLQSNYVSKTDPNSGYLSTKGGTMSGNINMGGNSITNVKMPDAKELKALDQSAAATVGYVMQMADTVTNNSEINTAVTKLSDISSKVSVIEAALGIPPSQEAPPEGEEPEEPAPDTSLFVRISGSTMSGDLDMGSHAVKNIKTPSDSNPKDAANVEYVQSKITTPQIGFLGNTITGSTSVTDYFDWKTPTPPPPPPAPAPSPAAPVSPVSDPDESPVTPSPSVPKPVLPAPIRMETSQGGASGVEGPKEPEKTDNVNSTPISDKYLKIEESDTKTIKVLCTGILILSVTANWSEGTSANISVILNPSATGTDSSEPASRTSKTDTAVYTVSAVSGQNLFFQIPVQKPSDLKLKLNSTTNGTPARASKASLTLSSWSWQTTLLPSIFPEATTP